MRINVAQAAATPSAIVADLVPALGAPAVVIYFASSTSEFGDVARAVADAFPGVATFGCTTAGEIISGSMSKGSIVAMGIDASTVAAAHVALVEGISTSLDGVDAALAGWERELGTPILGLDHQRWVGIVLVDGLSGAEERLMERIGDLANIPFVGGSAGDDLAFARTLVAANGTVASDAAVLVLLECPNGYDLLKTESFVSTGKVLTPTRVNTATREVMEFDGQPAAPAYAAAVGKAVEHLSDEFMVHPLGLMVSGEPYVRSPQQVIGDSVRFYCAVDEGMPLSVLESGDIVDQTRTDLAAAIAHSGEPAGIVNFNCILRTLELEARGQTDAYGKLFADVPTIGFSTYGEEYIGHINQTATMLLLR